MFVFDQIFLVGWVHYLCFYWQLAYQVFSPDGSKELPCWSKHGTSAWAMKKTAKYLFLHVVGDDNAVSGHKHICCILSPCCVLCGKKAQKLGRPPGSPLCQSVLRAWGRGNRERNLPVYGKRVALYISIFFLFVFLFCLIFLLKAVSNWMGF